MLNGSFKALMQFGAPLNQISVNNFVTKDVVFQIGVAPRRIDIRTFLSKAQTLIRETLSILTLNI